MRKVFIVAVVCRVVEASLALTTDEIKQNVISGLSDFISSDDKSLSVGVLEIPEDDTTRQPQPVD